MRSNKIFAGLAIAAAAALAGQSAHAAIMSVFTDRTAFEAAVAGYTTTTETFETVTTPTVLGGAGNAIGSGLTLDVSPNARSFILDSGGVINIEDFGFLGNGLFEVEFNDGNMLDGAFGSGRINFPTGVIAFGFDFAAAQPDNGAITTINAEEIVFSFDGENYLLSDLLGLTTDGVNSTTTLPRTAVASGFVGFLLSDVISALTLIHANDVVPGGVNHTLESITFDNFTFAQTSVVPLPAAAWVFLAGIAGLIGVGKRKRLQSARRVKGLTR